MGLAAILVGAPTGWTQSIELGPLTVRLQEMATGLAENGQFAPTSLAPLNDGTGRSLVTTYGGVVRVRAEGGNLLPTPLLTAAQTGTDPQREDGLTAVAVHPDFATAQAFGFGKVYTLGTEDLGSGAADFGVPGAHQDVLREWDLNALVGDAGSNVFLGTTSDSREILRVDQPGEFHNLFDLAFGPTDQLLYITSGDGGRDSRQSQDLSSIYGNILRVDPDNTATGDGMLSANGEYRIPFDNPFTATADALGEIWAYGLRAPYRMSFDSSTGRLYLGDVGGGSREEVNLVEKGGNYGWPIREGARGGSCPTCTDPIFDYAHVDGETVVGGLVYRGTAFPELQGKYLFADFGRQVTSGQAATPARLFYGELDQQGRITEVFELRIEAGGEQLVASNGRSLQFIFSIEEDHRGELLLLVGDDPTFPGAINPDGRVFGVTSPLLPGMLGDVNLDGVVSGDGAGSPLTDDVAAFVLGWKTTGHDTATAMFMHGDMNLDGLTDLLDWHLLRANHPQAEGLDLGALLAPQVPEPSSLALIVLSLALCGGRGARI